MTAKKKEVVAKEATEKKEVKAPKEEKKVVSKSVKKRVKIQKEEAPKKEKTITGPKYPTVDGLKVVDIISSTPTEKECVMEDGSTRFVEVERFDK